MEEFKGYTTLKGMEEFVKTNKACYGENPHTDTEADLSYYAYQEIVINVNDKLYKRVLQWDELHRKFYVEYDKKAYTVTRDYRELPTIFILLDEIV